MDKQKWDELTERIDKFVALYRKTKRERDELRRQLTELQQEIENSKKENIKLARETKNEILLKDRIAVLEEDRKVIREKTKNLLKVLKEF